ncbi:hypothetical protein WH8501_30695 (plasmid) [Crocosphaera watsonii WH 8501]|uniref:Uncharacterized protein n=2 Tax=Crocosphaera watsonii TaxID=263511 RepID=Q4BW59_CROWT|nr:hypothetical protein [Crocosphaera watsonii]EAM48144.1 hypothetical protein CwatDRAFT_0500 [Crocosphaera watsonii WH 8501]CCQ49504.1 hypothetical protein CWATWH8502_4928 [Crocosphaera watsonii WH 8502]
MRKPRPKTPTPQEIENFAAKADTIPTGESAAPPNPRAPRKYKSIAVPFNEYEFAKLEWLCEQTGMSKNALIRYLILTHAKALEREELLYQHQIGTR